MSIHIIQAGGTIDKDYLPTATNHGYNFVIGESAFHAISKRAGIPYQTAFTSACLKDSLDMDDTDRETIKQIVSASHEDKIIITHGTDTIHITAKHLASITDKVIVLTDAMKPERFLDSDADFNFGMAVGAVHCLPPGIYIALYGEVKGVDQYVPR